MSHVSEFPMPLSGTYRLKSYGRLLRLLALLACLWFGAPLSARAQESQAANDPAQVKASLNRILSNPEFQPETVQESAVSRFFKWLGDKWDEFWKWFRKALGFDRERSQGPPNPTSAILSWIFIRVFILAGVILLAYLIRGAILRYLDSRDTQQSRKKSAFDIDSADADMVREPDVWVQQAHTFANSGDYRRAIRALFLAILLQLDRAGAIEYQRFRTNGDYLRLLRGKGYDALVQAFRPFVLDFEIRWYGDRITAENDYRNCLNEYERLRDMILATDPAPSTLSGRA